MAVPAEERQPETRSPAALVRDPRDQDDGDERDDDADQHEPVGPALEHDPGHDRDDRRKDAGDGRDDPHPTDREAAIQRHDARSRR